PEYREAILANWEEPFGDMRQELVFIGQNIDQEAITRALDACLLDDEQLLAGQAFWRTLNDPFPAWD
ncbi:MAG: 4-hydroxytetrahydrobiopterin dehydratase, partial [Euryarchaeota archaeon]|nr:4-hydroxytetrahydrobiopterin dehydratase [Marinobacter sp.]